MNLLGLAIIVMFSALDMVEASNAEFKKNVQFLAFEGELEIS